MKDSYNLVIGNNRLKYEFILRRQITVIKGDSGTGKSTLVDMFNQIYKEKRTGLHCNLSDKLIVLDNPKNWKDLIISNKNKIFIADEDSEFVQTQEFAQYVQNSDNYFIFITRSGRMIWLTYSVNDIYELQTTKDEHGNFITSLYSRYFETKHTINPDLIITEDSNSGKEMFDLVLGHNVTSACGKDKIYNVLKDSKFNFAYIIVDGSAFGSCIGKLLNKFGEKICIFAPESFEYLLLNTSVFNKYVFNELRNTENYCDSKIFISWERYYTKLLSDLCLKFYGFTYTKSKLQQFFKTDIFITEIRNQITDDIIGV